MWFQKKSVVKHEKITITIYNKGFLKNEKIGTFAIDLSEVYFGNETHTIEHAWIGLNNPESEDFGKITGILRVSVAVQAEGDKGVNLALPDETKMDLSKERMLMSAAVKRELRQL